MKIKTMNINDLETNTQRIERLEAERDHWRTEYKTLELAGEVLVRQRDGLAAELDTDLDTLGDMARQHCFTARAHNKGKTTDSS